MKRISINSPCPCGSRDKYKKCCQKFHKGALVPNPLLLMKSRYSAYAIGNSKYIIDTTHPNSSEYMEDKTLWQNSILEFSKNTQFISLEILEYIPPKNNIAYVTFKAQFQDSKMIEKSRFLLENGKWLYENAVFIEK